MKGLNELRKKDKRTVRDIESGGGETDRWRQSEIEADTSQGPGETDVER